MSEKEWETACHRQDTCALTGTAAFFMGIPKSHVLINGPLWCYYFALRYLENAAGYVSSHVTCTQPSGTAVIYGTEEDLLRGFERIRQTDTPERVFVENNCSISLIGDDVAGIASRAELPWPVHVVDSGGVRGGFAGGFVRGLQCVLGEMKPQETEPGTVNILGLTPFLLKGEQDGAEIRRLLEQTGLRVLTMPGAGSTWEDILRATAAEWNLVVRDELGLAAARQMERDFGIPYLSVGLPYGMTGTELWLRAIADRITGMDLSGVTEEIRGRNRRMRQKAMDMESLWGPLWFDRILVAALPSEAAGLAEAVRSEWADTERLTVILQHPGERDIPAADEVLTCGKDDQRIKDFYEAWEGGLLLGSAHDESRLIRLKKNYLSCLIAYPATSRMFFTDQPFCGVRGAEYLYERLWNIKLTEQMRNYQR